MGVANFPEKFKIIEHALERAAKKLVHKRIAAAVFGSPQVAPASAEVMWSDCRKGRRKMRQSKVGALVRAINAETDGLFNDIAPDVFLKSTRVVEQAFIDARLIDSRRPEPGPLSERLTRLSSVSEVTDLLKNYTHTFETSNEFEVAFQLLSEAKMREVAGLFCGAVQENWGSRGHLRAGMVIGAILARIWPSLAHLPEMDSLNNFLETRIGDLSPRAVGIADAFCYIGTLHGRHGAFKTSIERMIEDPLWRRTDFREQLRYHHGYENLGRHIAWHLIDRRRHPQVLCNDVGRVISVYPELVKHRAFADLALFIKEETIKSLLYADIEPSLRARVEDIMEQRHA